VTGIHQVLPIVEPGAVGAHARAAREILRAAGHDSELFTPLVHPEAASWGAHTLDDYRRHARPGDRLVYQLAIGSTAADFVLGRPEPLVVNSHNLTPLRFLAGWDPVGAHGVAWGRSQLRSLAERAVLGIGVSRYNEAELVEAGFARTAAVPYLLDLRSFDVEPDPATTRHLAATRTTHEWLFVGRLAPNKAQHDVIKAFAAFRRFHDADARLHLLGGGRDAPFGVALASFVDALGLHDAVVMTGAVTPSALAAHYRAADVLVVLSEHEGFCVPVLEAMHHGVPVVAFRAAAVPETLGDAGLLLDAKDPCTVAAAVARVRADTALRSRLVAAGHARLPHFDITVTGPELVRALEAA
jgi:glycosyltransferase involved in cell wall biosynthesis